VAEYRTLLEAAGFREVEGRMTGAPLDACWRSRVECPRWWGML